MDAAVRKQILDLAREAHALTESSYQADLTSRTEPGWHDKQRILLGDMAIHLLQIALRQGPLADERLRNTLYSILTISDQFLPGYQLAEKANQLIDEPGRN